MNIIDTHVHLDFPQFREDMEQVIDRAKRHGINTMVNIGTDLKTSQNSVNLAGRYQDIYAAVGVHPHSAEEFAAMSSQIKSLAKESKVVAIGEIGLDYFRNLAAHESQQAAFAEQLKLALGLKKPVVIHCRDAYGEAVQILERDYLPHLGGRIPGVIHSFTAGPAHARKFLQMGFYIGLNNMLTYPQNAALQEAAKDMPLNRIVLETDCPFLPPQQIRKARCEPMHVSEVAKKLAEIKGLPLKEVCEQTTANARQLFGI
ncbi:MAG: TatD family hydrolase [Patescibacteria group bacterium]|nr:TatD family hydrolase [Patescibacteria group bacterium]